MVLRGGDVARPPLESYLNWVPDPVPPPAQRPGDLTSPASLENTLPQDVRDEAWAALKHLTGGSKEIIELAGETEKLAKRLRPRDEEAAERHAVDAFLSALDRPLAAEVRKLGHNQMEGVVADARRIEKILQEQPTSGAESVLETMNRQIQILKKDLVKANERLAAQTTTPPKTASLALPATPTVAAAQPPPASFAPPQRPQAVAPPPQPMVTAQTPQYLQDYLPQYYRNEDPQYFRRHDRRQDRRSVRCFLCDEEGHFAYRCPARTLLQRLLRQEQARRPPQVKYWSFLLLMAALTPPHCI